MHSLVLYSLWKIDAMFLGNSCVIKCSELAVATSNVLHKLIPKYLDEVCAELREYLYIPIMYSAYVVEGLLFSRFWWG